MSLKIDEDMKATLLDVGYIFQVLAFIVLVVTLANMFVALT